jgi:chemotaxis protein CheZ
MQQPAVRMEDERLAGARALVAALEAGDEQEATRLLGELTRVHESAVFVEMGRLTRQLHDSLCRVDVDDRLRDLAKQEIPEAKERLAYVVRMTEQAANQTLGAVEASLPVSARLEVRARELAEEWARFGRRELEPAQLRDLGAGVGEFLANVTRGSGEIHANLSEILTAQAFQDLTGQVLRRVTALVQEVEDNLVNLIRLSSGRAESERAPESPRPTVEPAGPLVATGPGPGGVASQDEVDALLSSLGF